jgi:hypothetical protein
MTNKEVRKIYEGQRLADWLYTDDKRGYLTAKKHLSEGVKAIAEKRHVAETYWAAKYYLEKVGEL